MIASLSIPWGYSKGDDDLGGYHLVWPRDLVETAGGLLAAGASEQARRVLSYLRSTQEPDGHWPQNMWLDGTPYWGGTQMDEVAFPILLVDLSARQKLLDGAERAGLWRMVKRAATFIVQNGPVTQQDRWEEDPGYSPFTLAAEIAALLAAADLADENGEPSSAAYLRETADTWNDGIEVPRNCCRENASHRAPPAGRRSVDHGRVDALHARGHLSRGAGVHLAALPTERLPRGTRIAFRLDGEEKEYSVTIAEGR